MKTEIYKQNCSMWDRHSYFTNLYYFWLGTLAEKGQHCALILVFQLFLKSLSLSIQKNPFEFSYSNSAFVALNFWLLSSDI